MRRPVAWLAALLGGWAVAVLQPVLGPLGGSPEFFVAHRADPLDILILTAVLALAFPLLLWGLALAGLLAGRRVGVVVAATAIGLVTAPAALEAAYSAGITGWPASIAVALSAAALVAAAWHRVSPVRTFLALLVPAILIVPVLFLLAPGMRSLLWNAATAEPGAHAASPAPVVVVVFDEMSLTSLLGRDGALDAGRYPHLTALARDGTWYRHATTVSDFTQWALPAILTGRYPRPDTTPTARDHPRSVFTALSADYRLEVREPVTAVCPQTLCGPGTDTRTARLGSELRDVRVVAAYVFLPPAARQWLPSLTQGWANFDAASDADGSDRPGGLPADRDAQVGLERIRQVRAFVDGISREDGQPTLYFLHTLISHHPPRWLPSGQVIAEREDVPAPLQNGRWPQDAVAVAEHFQGHLLQAELADTVVGWLVDRLVQQEMYDRALVVVTADHGASFRPGDAMRDLTDTNAGDIVPVPLIVKLPGQRMAQAVDDRRAQTVDILPTIADAIDLELPFEPDGRSLLTSAAADREVRVYRAKATRMVTYSPDALTALQRAALDRQEGLFGDRRWPALLVPGVPDLIGRDVPALERVDNATGWDVRLARPLALENVNLSAAALPVQVTGTLERSPDAGTEPSGLAVAVNDRIVATTVPGSGTMRWYAMIPPSSLVSGANHLQVFLLDPRHDGQLVQSRAAPAPVSSPVNLVPEQAQAAGTLQHGLYGTESGDRRPFRWTNGRAVIDVPIDPARAPRTLDLSVRFTGRPTTRLQALVDGCAALDQGIPSGAWSRSVDLGHCRPKGYWAEIEILSDTHRPGGADRRTLGIAIERLTLR